MKSLTAAGLGFWAPGFPNLDARLAEVADPGHREPPCALLPPRMARRASLLTRMAIETVSQAAGAAGIEPGGVPVVFATARGEMQTLCELLDALAGDGQLSPMRFHNSVYNAAAGQFSVAAGNRAPSTTVVGGDETVPLALLEAFCILLGSGAPAVIVSFADEAIALPIVSPGESAAMAAAICLTREPRPGLPVLSAPIRGAPPKPGEPRPSAPANPVGCALPLLAALRRGVAGGPLPLGAFEGWTVDIAAGAGL
ncbi:MAG: beta-ketoacyl synthase chain length factor [Myxococcales bacterium]